MIKTPSYPSIIAFSPPFSLVDTFAIPTRAGISKVWAIIEVWLVLPPKSVAKPTTASLSIFAVSDGVSSLEMIMLPLSRLDKSFGLIPFNLYITWKPISW